MAALSARERWWWRAAGVGVAAIYLSLYPAQFALDWLRVRDLLRLALAGGALVLAALFVVWMRRRRAGWREWMVAALSGAAYLLVASRLEILQERVHLAEYGLLALAFREALAARAAAGPREEGAWPSTVAVALGALGLTASAGFCDELIQLFLPNRRYDLRDVALNALAAAMALGAAELLAAAQRQRRQREAG